MASSSDGPHPIGLAMDWVARITAVGLEMALPAIAGQWLDRRLDTNFLGLAGLVIGVAVGFWHLLLMTRSPGRKSGRRKVGRRDSGSGDSAVPQTDSRRESE